MSEIESNWQVIIGERGWVFAGRVTREGDHFAIRDGYIVRRWKTETKTGLGSLASGGPKHDDILDPCPTNRVHVLAVIGMIECDDAVWNAWAATQVRAPKKAKK